MAKTPAPAQVTRKVTLSTTTTPTASVSSNARYEHVVQLGPTMEYEDEKVLIQGQGA